MPLLTPVTIPAAGLQAGLRSEFLSIYKETENTELAELGKIMRFGIPSVLRTETYPYSDGMPHPRRWAKGTPIPREGAEFKSFTVSNVKWGMRIEWDREDREDSQIGNLYDQAREAGANFARLNRRLFFQVLLGSASPSLLASVPAAADGASLFSGSTRFGHASGNIVTGNGVATTAAIHRDFFSTISRFQLFTNPKGHALLDPNIAQRGLTIIHGAANLEVFQTAFRAMLVEKLVSAPTNIVPEVYRNISFMSVPEITDNDWYVALHGTQTKAIFEQERVAIEETVSNVQSGSDDARENDLEFIQWRKRSGIGVGMPYNIIQVNN